MQDSGYPTDDEAQDNLCNVVSIVSHNPTTDEFVITDSEGREWLDEWAVADFLIKSFRSFAEHETPESIIQSLTFTVEMAWAHDRWKSCLATLPCWPATAEGVEALPKHGACVYRIFGTLEGDPDEQLVLLYVGGTIAPRSRLKSHLSSGRFPQAQTIALEACVWSGEIAGIEERAIRWEMPQNNGGGGYAPNASW